MVAFPVRQSFTLRIVAPILPHFRGICQGVAGDFPLNHPHSTPYAQVVGRGGMVFEACLADNERGARRMGSLEWRWARIGVCPMSAKGKAGAGVIPATFQPFERLTCELIQ
jgi:hypothetical protein